MIWSQLKFIAVFTVFIDTFMGPLTTEQYHSELKLTSTTSLKAALTYAWYMHVNRAKTMRCHFVVI